MSGTVDAVSRPLRYGRNCQGMAVERGGSHADCVDAVLVLAYQSRGTNVHDTLDNSLYQRRLC